MWSTSAFQKALNKLTVEYITNKVGLLGIRCLLWPALGPFSEYFVRNGKFGVIFQSEEEEKSMTFNEPRVLINAVIGWVRTHLSRSTQRHPRTVPFVSTESSEEGRATRRDGITN